MTTLEQHLLDHFISKAIDWNDKIFTKHGLIHRCRCAVSAEGRKAKISVRKKGMVGYVKKKRSLFPGCPLGTISHETSDGYLVVDFPAAEMLDALGAEREKYDALAKFYERKNKPHYTVPIQSFLAIQRLASDIVEGCEIEDDLLEKIWMSCKGDLYWIIRHIMTVEAEAKRRNWKKTGLEQWSKEELLFYLDTPISLEIKPTAKMCRRPRQPPSSL